METKMETKIVKLRFRRGLGLGLLAGLLSSALSGSPAPVQAEPARELPPAAVFGRVAPSVVVIDATGKDGRSQGSGVVIAPELVVSNHHVVAAAAGIQVRQRERSWPATVEAMDAKRDLVLLRVPGLDLPRVALRPSALVTVGERVYAVGAPRGLELSLSDGLIAALRRDGKASAEGTAASGKIGSDGPAVLQTTAPVSPGSSGGGLFDAQARLVGVMTFSATAGQNLNFAHPTEWIEALKTATPSAAAVPKAAPRYGLTQRPWGLRCHLNLRSIWGLFSGGSELLESKPTRADIEFGSFDQQTPQFDGLVDDGDWSGELVLSDLNREAGFVAFVPSYARQNNRSYFFSADDDGQFRLTVLSSFEFRGQPRVGATSGPCETVETQPKNKNPLDAEERCQSGDITACSARAEAIAARDRTGALRLYLRGCDMARPEDGKTKEEGARACLQAAKLCEAMGFTSRASELRSRSVRLRSPAPAPAPASSPPAPH